MVYKIYITKRAKYLFDRIVGYIVYNLKNIEASEKFSKNVRDALLRIENNPYQFPLLIDEKVLRREYRVAQISNMNYRIIFRVIENEIYIVGIFHIKENINDKLY